MAAPGRRCDVQGTRQRRQRRAGDDFKVGVTTQRGDGGSRMNEFSKIDPSALNARQKENYNFLKVSAVLADYGFMTMRLSSDWQGADFIAQHIDGETFLKVQLKSRLGFYEKYKGKNIYITFPFGLNWYIYPHDTLLERVLAETGIGKTKSWLIEGGYSFPNLSEQMRTLLRPYMLGSIADNPAPAPGELS
jgi:hypothetical protein